MAKDKEFEKEYKIERLRRTRVRKKKRLEKKGSHTTCPKCGWDTGYYVGEIEDPYYKDMHNISIMVRMCTDCYNRSCGDI